MHTHAFTDLFIVLAQAAIDGCFSLNVGSPPLNQLKSLSLGRSIAFHDSNAIILPKRLPIPSGMGNPVVYGYLSQPNHS